MYKIVLAIMMALCSAQAFAAAGRISSSTDPNADFKAGIMKKLRAGKIRQVEALALQFSDALVRALVSFGKITDADLINAEVAGDMHDMIVDCLNQHKHEQAQARASKARLVEVRPGIAIPLLQLKKAEQLRNSDQPH